MADTPAPSPVPGIDRRFADVIDATALLAAALLAALRPSRAEQSALLHTLNTVSTRLFELRMLAAAPETASPVELSATIWDLCDLLRSARDHNARLPDAEERLDAVLLTVRESLIALARTTGSVRVADRDELTARFLELLDLCLLFDTHTGTFAVKLLDPALEVFLTAKRPVRPDWVWLGKVLGSTARLRAGEDR